MALKDKYLTITEAAQKVGVTRQTISRWIKKRGLPAEKLGREMIISNKKLLQFLDARKFAQVLDYDITPGIIDYLREKYKYSEKDKIERIRDKLEFSVIKENGNKEKIRIDEFETIVGARKTKNTVFINLKIKKTNRIPSKQIENMKINEKDEEWF